MEVPHLCRAAWLDSIGYEIPYLRGMGILVLKLCSLATCLFVRKRMACGRLKALCGGIYERINDF